MFAQNDTIIAPATSPGGALSVIRISGNDSLTICDKCFRSPSGKKLSEQAGYTIHFGNIVSADGAFIDEALVSVFRSPTSYTGENMAEISCHGSRWITSEIIRALLDAGARLADAGEFTVRAFLAGKLDLAQAEAVADMIASDNKAAHSLASTQLRGKYSKDLSSLRGELLHLASLLELELDFSEEDVTFADRSELSVIIQRTTEAIESLSSTFSLGNAVKEGIGVALIGNPNAGKSTLLNAILGDDRAMVSDIAGTTRDVIEERFNIDGIGFRFIDTAGIRHSDDILEQMGIERTYKAAAAAQVILYMVDATDATLTTSDIESVIKTIPLPDSVEVGYSDNNTEYQNEKISDIYADDNSSNSGTLSRSANRKVIIVVNKCDSADAESDITTRFAGLNLPIIAISAKYGRNISGLKSLLTSVVDSSSIFGDKSIVTNARHYHSLLHAIASLNTASVGLASNIPSDLLAQDLRSALHHIGTITGEITTDNILSEIFSKFCIGK